MQSEFALELPNAAYLVQRYEKDKTKTGLNHIFY